MIVARIDDAPLLILVFEFRSHHQDGRFASSSIIIIIIAIILIF